ncbi:MAG: hypothetical protein OXD37_00565 [Acidimicrobiaceae bacterium]|nr:hypothetical protein [Acidimicrobiaceae bacterium]
MTVADLQAALAAVSLAKSPDDWALAAYRLAVAQSESARRPADVDEALELLDKAARILSAERAPVEHGRILTAAANCHRARGNHHKTLELFERAAGLLDARAPINEQAGAHINVGLARSEAGRPHAGVEAADRAIDLLTREAETARCLVDGTDGEAAETAETAGIDLNSETDPAEEVDPTGPTEETRRLLGAAHINRAQARQALSGLEDLELAADDYRSALGVLAAESLQAGMAAHGLGATLLELCRRDSARWPAGDAVAAFEQCLNVLSHRNFPFHHAVARHSLALAYEARGEPGDPARALNSAQAAISMFDPRLHASHWRTAHDTLARLTAVLDEARPGADRNDHIARLLADIPETERDNLLRDRLLRAASLPATGQKTDLGSLISSLASLDADDYRQVLRSLIGVLMELPDRLLETACATICGVHAGSCSPQILDEMLDTVITERLFGPQRVRVRDLLEAEGWVRP